MTVVLQEVYDTVTSNTAVKKTLYLIGINFPMIC